MAWSTWSAQACSLPLAWGLGGPTDRNHSCSSKLKTHWAFSTPVIAAKTRHSIAIYSRVELPVLYYNLCSTVPVYRYRYLERAGRTEFLASVRPRIPDADF